MLPSVVNIHWNNFHFVPQRNSDVHSSSSSSQNLHRLLASRRPAPSTSSPTSATTLVIDDSISATTIHSDNNVTNKNENYDASVEFLCNLGMAKEWAVECLASIPTHDSIPTPSHLETLCLLLVTHAKVPVSKLAFIIQSVPSILSLSPDDLAANIEALDAAWSRPRRRGLQSAILAYPPLLESSFASDLQRCITNLRGMGFSTSQTAEVITSCPQLVGLRRYEITNALAACGLTINKITDARVDKESILEFLASNPACMTPQGSKKLLAVLEAIRKGTGGTVESPQYIVIRSPRKFPLSQKPKHIRKICDILVKYLGLSPAQVGQMIVQYPNLVFKNRMAIEQTVYILSLFCGNDGRDKEKRSRFLKPENIAAYPRIFTHHPMRAIGPRLSYLMKKNPGYLESNSLRTTMTCNDVFFAIMICKDDSADEFLDFKERWEVSDAENDAGGVDVFGHTLREEEKNERKEGDRSMKDPENGNLVPSVVKNEPRLPSGPPALFKNAATMTSSATTSTNRQSALKNTKWKKYAVVKKQNEVTKSTP